MRLATYFESTMERLKNVERTLSKVFKNRRTPMAKRKAPSAAIILCLWKIRGSNS
jgi:hypothetical protein